MLSKLSRCQDKIFFVIHSIEYVSLIMFPGGLETESDYKYEGYGEKCKFNASEAKVKVTGAVNISQNEGGKSGNEWACWLILG